MAIVNNNCGQEFRVAGSAWHGIPAVDPLTVLRIPTDVADCRACGNCRFYHGGRFDYTFRPVDSGIPATVTYRVAGSREYLTFVWNCIFGLWQDKT